MGLIDFMQDPQQGVSIKDRRWKLTIYKMCFVGSEFVDWALTKLGMYSRPEACVLGQRLADLGIVWKKKKKKEFKKFSRFNT
jgi:potassium efflux system protein